jgi:hypothetical protein
MPSYGGGDDAWVEVIWTPTRRDIRRSVAAALRNPVCAVAAGIVLLLGVVATVVCTTETEEAFLVPWIFLPPALFVAAYLMALPHVAGWLVWYVQRSARLTETLRADLSGVRFTTMRATRTIPWREVRRVRETDELMVLVARRGLRTLAAPIPMRVLPLEERTTIRALIAENGLHVD